MLLDQVLQIANRTKAELAPHCERIEIAGSIRRKKPEPKDIEIVCIPKPYDIGLFESGFASVVGQWKKVKGELPCKYTQRLLPEGIKLDLFMVTSDNWGYQLAIRTGSADYSHLILARGWSKNGYKGVDGMLTQFGGPVPVREEEDLFRLAGVEWVEPELREVESAMNFPPKKPKTAPPSAGQGRPSCASGQKTRRMWLLAGGSNVRPVVRM